MKAKFYYDNRFRLSHKNKSDEWITFEFLEYPHIAPKEVPFWYELYTKEKEYYDEWGGTHIHEHFVINVFFKSTFYEDGTDTKIELTKEDIDAVCDYMVKEMDWADFDYLWGGAFDDDQFEIKGVECEK